MNHSRPDDAYDLQELWQRFKGWLQLHAPGDYGTLHPGASREKISRLESDIGFPLNGDLKALLAMSDGVVQRVSSMDPGAFILGYSLLGTVEILEGQRYLSSMAEGFVEDGYEEAVGRIAHTRWVPFAQGVTGDVLFVDHRDGHFGEVGEMSFGSPEYQLLWPGLGLMLRDLCSAVEGMTGLPEIGVYPLVHEGRMLEWPTL
ncbi:SMI1/KNR4 family protein [Streptomyces sp. MUM 178J]|uniref:SMI1/KNR4 family protein n=1 Tax=Streptomyces sp. MUM 178J TaxID=2791991 RepID=UPI001F0398DD|nr:SMI1/KNR4 family protein [Streptomyces sp. MUM 178J]WRQ79535.1 SMI1/KNR4 family protein [Streptomyces sp. MUM 178J]